MPIAVRARRRLLYRHRLFSVTKAKVLRKCSPCRKSIGVKPLTTKLMKDPRHWNTVVTLRDWNLGRAQQHSRMSTRTRTDGRFTFMTTTVRDFNMHWRLSYEQEKQGTVVDSLVSWKKIVTRSGQTKAPHKGIDVQTFPPLWITARMCNLVLAVSQTRNTLLILERRFYQYLPIKIILWQIFCAATTIYKDR